MEKKSEYEKKRIDNINKSMTLKYSIGLPMPDQKSLRAKLGINRRRFKAKVKVEDKDDFEWKPNQQKLKKQGPKAFTPAQITNRKVWVEENLLVDENGDPAKSKDIKGFERKQKAKKNVKKEKKEELRRSGRNVERVNYADVYSDDFVFCYECESSNFSNCSTHPKLTFVKDTEVPMGVKHRAVKTCPLQVDVNRSKIKDAGNGVFASESIPENTVYGPYEGVIVNPRDIIKADKLRAGGYAWEITKDGKLEHYIDAKKPSHSNWMRFVNCARYEEEQNLIAFQFKQQIYYKTFRNINKKDELLTWYGTEYDKDLGISFLPTKVEYLSQVKLLANPEVLAMPDVHECKFCDSLFASVEVLQTHIKNKHESYIGEKKKFACDLCEYSTNKSSSLNEHKLTHNKIKSHECHLCGKFFGRKDHLSRHIKSIHEKQKFKCELCSKEFTYKCALNKHIKNVHEKPKPHVCPVCDEKFSQEIHLNDHIRTHTGEKPYKCSFCEKSFTQLVQLKDHEIRIHTKNYPHKCAICDKGFVTLREFKKHMSSCH